jgi:hypothetical protein
LKRPGPALDCSAIGERKRVCGINVVTSNSVLRISFWIFLKIEYTRVTRIFCVIGSYTSYVVALNKILCLCHQISSLNLASIKLLLCIITA